MNADKFNRYIVLLVTSFLTLVILITTCNWFINPYGVYASPGAPGLNVLKPEILTHARIYKASAIRMLKPKAIIMGTSRAERGIDPQHEGWSIRPVYNLGIPGAKLYETLRYFQHANNMLDLKQVLFQLDFGSFMTGIQSGAPLDESFLSVDYSGQKNYLDNINILSSTLFSKDALSSSIATIKQQGNANIEKYSASGMRPELRITGSQRYSFLQSERSYLTGCLPEYYQFDEPGQVAAPFDYYRKILQIAYREKIDLRMVIAPSHVRLWEVIAFSGLWPAFEEWKRRLVTINYEESELAGSPPYPIWDFSTYNELTMEQVPPLYDTESRMQWHSRTTYFKKELGDLMLDRVFGVQQKEQQLPENFGVLITVENIDEHLRNIRDDRQAYRNSHVDDMVEMEKGLSAEMSSWK